MFVYETKSFWAVWKLLWSNFSSDALFCLVCHPNVCGSTRCFDILMIRSSDALSNPIEPTFFSSQWRFPKKIDWLCRSNVFIIHEILRQVFSYKFITIRIISKAILVSPLTFQLSLYKPFSNVHPLLLYHTGLNTRTSFWSHQLHKVTSSWDLDPKNGFSAGMLQ